MTHKFTLSIHAFNLYCEKCEKKVKSKEELNGMVTVECDTDKGYCEKRDGVFGT